MPDGESAIHYATCRRLWTFLSIIINYTSRSYSLSSIDSTSRTKDSCPPTESTNYQCQLGVRLFPTENWWPFTHPRNLGNIHRRGCGLHSSYRRAGHCCAVHQDTCTADRCPPVTKTTDHRRIHWRTCKPIYEWSTSRLIDILIVESKLIGYYDKASYKINSTDSKCNGRLGRITRTPLY